MPRWLTYTFMTMALWGGWGLLSKPAADRISSWQTQMISAAGLLPVIVWLGCSRQLGGGLEPRRGFGLALLSGIIASLGNVAYYQALSAGGKAAAVTPITALYPVVTILLAVTLLGERLNRIQAGGVISSLAAIYLFNVGSAASWLSSWLAIAFIPIFLWGVSALLQKCGAMRARPELATLGFLLGALPVALLTPLWARMTWNLPVATWLLVLALGLFFGLGNLTLIFAYGLGGKASVVTPMAGLYSVVTIPLAVFILGERVTSREGLGMVFALVAAGALCYEKPSGTHAPA